MKSILKSYKKKGPLLNAFIDRKIRTRLRKKSLQYFAEGRCRMAIYANDWIGININIYGIYEKEELEILLDIFSILQIDTKSTKAVDVGANIGNHSLYFAKFFHKVLAFEPNPNTYKLLEYNASYADNVETFNFGFGKKNKTANLYEDATNFGGSSTIYKHEGEALSIDIRKLDDVELDLSDVALLKIDVEGMEFDVLSGGRKFIESNEPVIAFEQHVADFDENNETLSIRLLRSLGYQICWLERPGNALPWFFRRIRNVAELFIPIGSTTRIVTGEMVPKKLHLMLVAIPPKYDRAIRNQLADVAIV